jgi:phenylacetate-CoA ligase
MPSECTLGGAFHPASAPDYVPLAQMRPLRLERLRAVVRRAYDRVEMFRRRLDERSFPPDRLGALADIQYLPFTTKADLRDNYPFGLFASPIEDVVRVHASSGTTGKPIVVAYTRQDLDSRAVPPDSRVSARRAYWMSVISLNQSVCAPPWC